ncbi:hypothetical protein MUS1_10670 [Marinomonas ushuaiensis DSM 15871]|uniref:Uncharacterized protein n=1 Tax=Marinomonas ushuaiensis DSM 15871 TaxID=1122207 RepID=X7E7U6_9GAMM|nr:hypothetical protein [Marinomonas ushuaiensis]ETX11261.1 hypothetical protein MUS1_10670 [Marinomonas ushuaiensis DSM 15871]
MKSIFTASLLSFFFVMSQVVQAHPGHDHSHWMSNTIHMLSIFSVAALIVGGFVYKQLVRRRYSVKKKDINHDA